MIDLASTGTIISSRLANKPKQDYGLFAKLSLLVFGVCEVAMHPHIFLAGENQHIQEINRKFDGSLNHLVP